jgi:predicted  nucleic acid-binding Zn-ribbon protein
MKILMQNLLKLQTLEFGETKVARTATVVAELRSKIPPPILEHYDRLRVRGKKGVAAVQHQVCSGCHMQLPIGVIMTLKHGEDVQLCESCGRYLYLPEEVAAAPVTSPPVAKPARATRRRKTTAPEV